MQTSALLLHALYVFMRDQGLPTDELLHRSGLSLYRPEHTNAAVDSATLATAIQVALQAGAGESLALKLGFSTPLWALGTFGELIAQCTDLRSGLKAVKRFMPLLQRGGEITLEETAQQATIHYKPSFTREASRKFAIELALSMTASVAREFLGSNAKPLRVLLPYPAPAYATEYELLFRCPVEFNAPTAALCFAPATLHIPRPFVDHQLHEWLEAKLERVLRADDESTPLHEKIRAILQKEHHFVPSENTFRAIARRLDIAPRALRRKLCMEGLTLSGLVDESRKNLAIYLVVEADLPVKAIPKRLGFAELSTFYRAFRRWTGMTPLQYRTLRQRQIRADAA